MKRFLSLIFKGLRLLMIGLSLLGLFVGPILLFILVPRLLTDSEGLLHGIQNNAKLFILVIVSFGIPLVIGWLDGWFDGPQDTHSTSSSSYRSTSSSYSSSSSYSDSYSGSSSYDSKYHDELDAAQHAMRITEVYGDDWRGYDAEYSPEIPNPDPESFVDIDL